MADLRPKGSLQRSIGLEKSDLSAIEQVNKEQFEAQEKWKNDVKLKFAKTYHKNLDDLDAKAQEKIYKRAQKQNKKTLAERKKQLDDEYTYAETKAQRFAAATKKAALAALEGISTVANSQLAKGMDQYIGAYSKYMTGIETRLQGAGKSYNEMLSMISRNIGYSPYVRQADVLNNLSLLVKQGISYNVEQRAFLATVSDKIADTFNAFDSSLLQLIRIQQADSTAARLGLEASLTTFLNSTFGDTSYLSGLSSRVSSQILGASSQLGKEESVAFDYQIQKWLGSMSAVGVSESTLQNIAQGINYLGTGDISGLASNQTLQRLLVTASGTSYTNLLSQGLTAQNANELLNNIVSFAQQIGNIQNNVVRQQYASLFGFQLSDITALMNLTSQDLLSISQNMLSYKDTIDATTAGLASLGDRVSMQDKIQNVMDNVFASIGENIATNVGAYTTWNIANLLESSVGGLPVPVPTVGSIKTSDVLKAGLVGYGLISEIGNISSALQAAGQLSLQGWGATDYTSRGLGTSRIRTTGVTSGISASYAVGNIDASNIGSIARAEDQETITGASQSISDTAESNASILTILQEEISVDVHKILNLLSNGITIKSKVGI